MEITEKSMVIVLFANSQLFGRPPVKSNMVKREKQVISACFFCDITVRFKLRKVINCANFIFGWFIITGFG